MDGNGTYLKWLGLHAWLVKPKLVPVASTWCRYQFQQRHQTGNHFRLLGHLCLTGPFCQVAWLQSSKTSSVSQAAMQRFPWALFSGPSSHYHHLWASRLSAKVRRCHSLTRGLQARQPHVANTIHASIHQSALLKTTEVEILNCFVSAKTSSVSQYASAGALQAPRLSRFKQQSWQETMLNCL